MEFITIVIPCYNATRYIEKCIYSLEQQTFKKFKVILVDDCSTDDTYEHLHKLKAHIGLNIEVLQNEKNSGPAVSRNKGILATDTKYITFCDSDDWYEPSFLNTMLSLIENNDADLVFCGYKVVDENNHIITRPVYNKTGSISREYAFSLDADSLCMLMVRTDLMKDTLLPVLRNGEDVATVPLLMAKANKIAVTNECLYNYYRRSDSASESPNMSVINSLIKSFQFIRDRFPKEYNLELEFLGAKNLLYATIINLFSFSYDKKKARSILADFEESYPQWHANPYLKSLRLYKRVVLWCIHMRLFFLIKLLSETRNIIMKSK